MNAVYWPILLTSTLAGLTAGFVMHRSNFCMSAAFRDLFLVRDAYLLRSLALLVVISMVLFELGRLAGTLPDGPVPLLGPGSLTTLLAGFVFGVGMVLAGGCVVGTLYKLGTGSAPSAVALVGLLAGAGLYAEWHPAWTALAKASVITDGSVTLAEWLSLPSPTLVLPVAALSGIWLWRAFRAGGAKPAVPARTGAGRVARHPATYPTGRSLRLTHGREVFDRFGHLRTDLPLLPAADPEGGQRTPGRPTGGPL